MVNRVPNQEQAASRVGKELALLAAVTLPHLSVSYGGNGVSVLMPLLQRDLGLSSFQVGLLGGARFAGLIVLSIPAAALVTRVGLQRSIVLLQVGFGLSMAALAAAMTPAAAILALAFGSIFFAATNPATTTAVMVRFPATLRAQAMNSKQVGVPLGSLLAAISLPVLATAVGWRTAFVAVAGLAALAGLFSWMLDARGREEERAVILPASSPLGLAALVRHRPVLITTVIQGLLMAAQASTLTYFVVFLVGRGIPLIAAAGYLAVLQVAGVLARILWGVVADRGFGGRRRPALAAVMAFSAAGVAALAIVPPGVPGWVLGAAAILLGLGVVAYAGMVELVRAELVDPATTAAATGFGYALASIGGVAGPPLFGLIAQAHGFSVAWAALAALLVCGLVLPLALSEPGLAAAASRAENHRSK